jgi:hypothetical protein
MRVAFLDQHGRFAKQPSDVAEVRIFPTDDPGDYQSLTAEQFKALQRAEQQQLRLADSAAGLIDTSQKSNA